MQSNRKLDHRVWIPLEKFLGSAEACGAFMFMGWAGSVYLYKNIVTRQYINLGSDGKRYRYEAGGYVLIETEGDISQGSVAAVAAVAELLPRWPTD